MPMRTFNHWRASTSSPSFSVTAPPLAFTASCNLSVKVLITSLREGGGCSAAPLFVIQRRRRGAAYLPFPLPVPLFARPVVAPPFCLLPAAAFGVGFAPLSLPLLLA